MFNESLNTLMRQTQEAAPVIKSLAASPGVLLFHHPLPADSQGKNGAVKTNMNKR